MPADISFNFNWIDILMVCIMGRVFFVGIKSNIVHEVFRVVGILAAIFITLHYYIELGETLNEYVFIPERVQEFLAFALLWATVVVLFKLIADGWTIMLRVEAHPVIDKWFGVFTSLIRGFLICSLTLMLFLVMHNDYLTKSARRSLSGAYVIDVSPGIYRFFFDQLISKYFLNEKLNTEAFELKNIKPKKD